MEERIKRTFMKVDRLVYPVTSSSESSLQLISSSEKYDTLIDTPQVYTLKHTSMVSYQT